MIHPKTRLALAIVAVACALSSCDTSNVQTSFGPGMYFGTSMFNPWFYGPGYNPALTPGRTPMPVPSQPRGGSTER